MAIAKIQSSAVSAFQGNSTTVVSGTSTGYQRTLTVTAGSLLVACIFIANVGATGDLINDVTDSKGQTWTKRTSIRDTVENGLSCFYIYECLAAGAGSTTISLDCAIEDNNNFIIWDVTEYSGVGSVDTGIHDADAVNGAAGSVSTGPVTPSVDDTLVVTGVGARWWYYVQGNGVDDDSPPTGYTTNNLQNGNTYGQFQSAYRILTSAAAQTPSWNGPAGQSADYGAVAAVAVYRAATGTNLRIRAIFNTAINGDSGITAYVWTGEPSSVVATKFTGLTAEASGGVLLINLPSNTTLTNGQSVTVLAFNSADTSGLVTGTVETY